jgi:hypothetical protein
MFKFCPREFRIRISQTPCAFAFSVNIYASFQKTKNSIEVPRVVQATVNLKTRDILDATTIGCSCPRVRAVEGM